MAECGLALVLSGPSGAGKSTIAKELCRRDSRCRLSVSATTRAPRPGETEGVAYFFRTRLDFEKQIANNEFVEYEEYAGNYYGTPRAFLDSCVTKGEVAVLDIEVKGAARIAAQYPSAVRVFVLPPDPEELVSRLVARKTETRETLLKRLAVARQEIARMDEYDYLVVNDEYTKAADRVQDIIAGERLRLRGGEREAWLGGRPAEDVLCLPDGM